MLLCLPPSQVKAMRMEREPPVSIDVRQNDSEICCGIFPVKWKRNPSLKSPFMRIGMYSFYFSWNMMSASNMYSLYRRENCKFLHVFRGFFVNLNFVMLIHRPQTNSLHHKICFMKAFVIRKRNKERCFSVQDFFSRRFWMLWERKLQFQGIKIISRNSRLIGAKLLVLFAELCKSYLHQVY